MGKIIFVYVIALTSMFRLNATLTLASLVMAPVSAYASYRFFNAAFDISEAVEKSEAKLSSIIQENISGMRVIRAFGRQRKACDTFDVHNKAYADKMKSLVMINGNYWPKQEFILYLQKAIVVFIGVKLAVSGQITLGTYIAFLALIDELIDPMMIIGRLVNQFSKVLVAAERIDGVLKEQSEFTCAGENCDLSGDIEFKQVSFKYDGDTRMILNNINLKIKRGQTVAIIGPTGSGKSTLAHLLTRFYDVTSGDITIGGTSIKSVDKFSLRRHVGIILQETFLFAKSIKDNISIAKPEASNKEIEAVAKISDIHDTVLNFDKGYDTLVGEKGISLSGGQQQRMAIARKLITASPVLIIDDSLSAVDTETDAKIRHRLNMKASAQTTIIISHRIATIADADHIVVLEDGEITESGDHKTLMALGGYYHKIYTIQDQEAEKEAV